MSTKSLTPSPACPTAARDAGVTTIVAELDRMIAGDNTDAADLAKRLTAFLECPQAQRAAHLLYHALGASTSGAHRSTLDAGADALAAPPGWLQPIP